MSETPPDMDKERLRRRNQRNWAVFIALLIFVALVYAITIVKIKTAGTL